MVITSFLVNDKDEKFCFFEETFLLADIGIDVAFEIFFLTLSIIKVNFNNWELKWKLYTTAKILLTIKKIKLIAKNRFAIIALNPEYKTFVAHIASIVSTSSDPVHFSHIA